MKKTIQQKLFYYDKANVHLRKIEELEKAEHKVMWLLRNMPHLRDCDKCLINNFWFKTEYTLSFHDRTAAETITRSRRFIQNELKLCRADELVTEKRKEKQLVYTQYYRDNKQQR